MNIEGQTIHSAYQFCTFYEFGFLCARLGFCPTLVTPVLLQQNFARDQSVFFHFGYLSIYLPLNVLDQTDQE